MKLGEIPTGALVVKLDAQPVDLAYFRLGIVHREGDMTGVEWLRGSRSIIEYSADTDGFEAVRSGSEIIKVNVCEECD
jgi:hypothetical protein